jgi:dihydrofolate reductase
LRVVEIVADSTYGRDLAWNFVTQNWKELEDRYAFRKANSNIRYLGGNFLLASMIPYITERFTTQAKYDEVKQFFQENKVTLRAVSQSLETIDGNIKWLAENSDELRQWLQNWQNSQHD